MACRILQEPQSIPVHSNSTHAGFLWIRPQRDTEDGSSVPTGNFPYRKRSNSDTFPLLVSSGNIMVSHGKPTRTSSYTGGIHSNATVYQAKYKPVDFFYTFGIGFRFLPDKKYTALLVRCFFTRIGFAFKEHVKFRPIPWICFLHEDGISI